MNETHENASQVAHAVRTAAAWDVLLSASAAGANESDRGRIRSLLERSVDWEAVLRLAERHGTSSLVFQNLAGLGGVVPAGVLAAVRQDYERNIHKSLFLARELICVLDCLDALGVEAVPYKGVVLSEVYYGDVAMRQAGDIDLFVRKGDVGRIKDAVRELNFDTRFIRKWNYYLSYCEAAFARRNISVVQAVYTRPNNRRLAASGEASPQ